MTGYKGTDVVAVELDHRVWLIYLPDKISSRNINMFLTKQEPSISGNVLPVTPMFPHNEFLLIMAILIMLCVVVTALVYDASNKRNVK